GYNLQVGMDSLEYLALATEHHIERQPLMICDSQMNALKSSAKPQDRVLYLSMLVMPYYFAHGSMQFGAMYYHPSIKNTPVTKEWLSGPELRFVVGYNPLMFHPFFERLHERRWVIPAPTPRYVPRDIGRKYGPVIHEDTIPMAQYKWIEVEPIAGPPPRTLELMVHVEGDPYEVRLIPVTQSGELRTDMQVTQRVRARMTALSEHEYEGEDLHGYKFPGVRATPPIPARFNLEGLSDFRRFRIVFSGWRPKVGIAGIRFDDSALHWPWMQKARLTLMHRDWEVGQMNFSFDPGLLLPEPLNAMNVTVVDDCGSSVLMRINR
ncbi:MAG: hypothetical protein FJY85_17915, partial [Deltaproteobacteria bacterium]|nr:hypothetical protein [Deltaproteobacteria bacterium]